MQGSSQPSPKHMHGGSSLSKIRGFGSQILPNFMGHGILGHPDFRLALLDPAIVEQE
jgi:hypothetical protein